MSPTEHTGKKKEPLLADFFAKNVANLSAAEQGPSFMTCDLRRKRF